MRSCKPFSIGLTNRKNKKIFVDNGQNRCYIVYNMKAHYDNLKSMIEAKGWTEREAAQHFGCSVAMISRVINRLRKPGGKMTMKMLAAGIDVKFHFDLRRSA
jgi:hypothetical protein